jgi:hypothetical protein
VARNDLHEFLRRESERIAAEYARIAERVKEDPGTAGHQGEGNWLELLRNWLPHNYQIVTKGRIMGPTGETSGQVDVLVLSPSYPKALINTKLYLSGGVVAAFECKITLRPEHITRFFENCVAIKRLASRSYGTPYRELQSPIIFGLLAHSHAWTAPGSTPAANVAGAIDECDARYVGTAFEMPDLICLSDVEPGEPSR